MRADHALDGHSRWWISGGAAVCTHLAVMLVLPDAPHQTRREHSAFFEFDLTTTASADTDVAATRRSASDATGPSDTPNVTQPARATTLRSRVDGTRASAARGAAVSARSEPTSSSSAAQRERAALEASRLGAARVHDAVVHSVHTSLSGWAAAEGLVSAQNETARPTAAAPLGAPMVGGVGSGDRGGATGHGRGHAPGLLAAHNPCSGYFPATARVNQGAVQLSVHVDAEGHARAARILNELPVGQEFGQAARACAAALRFAPASNDLGMPVAGEAKLELRFSRS